MVGKKTPTAVFVEIGDYLPELKSIVTIGIFKDNTVEIWASQTPEEIERSALILQAFSDGVRSVHVQ